MCCSSGNGQSKFDFANFDTATPSGGGGGNSYGLGAQQARNNSGDNLGSNLGSLGNFGGNNGAFGSGLLGGGSGSGNSCLGGFNHLFGSDASDSVLHPEGASVGNASVSKMPSETNKVGPASPSNSGTQQRVLVN